MTLNLFSARNTFIDGDACAFLERVVIFVGRQIEENFSEFVIERYKIGYSCVEVKLFSFDFIVNFSPSFFGERLKD